MGERKFLQNIRQNQGRSFALPSRVNIQQMTSTMRTGLRNPDQESFMMRSGFIAGSSRGYQTANVRVARRGDIDNNIAPRFFHVKVNIKPQMTSGQYVMELKKGMNVVKAGSDDYNPEMEGYENFEILGVNL